LLPSHANAGNPAQVWENCPGAIGEVGVAANLVTFLASVGWGWVADRYDRRAAMIIPALIAIPLAPL
jgi:SHS family lactate transporter-like MFS transporter